jgi:hypothetical protein
MKHPGIQLWSNEARWAFGMAWTLSIINSNIPEYSNTIPAIIKNV